MKLTTTILAVGMMASGAWAQNPNVINNVQSTMNSVQQQKTNDSNAALGIKSAPPSNQATKPVAGAPAKVAGTPMPAPAKSTPTKTAPAKTATAVKTAPAPATSTTKTQAASQAKPAVTKTVAVKPTITAKSTIAVKTTAAAKTAVASKTAAPKQSAKGDKKTVISAAPAAKVEAKPVEAAKSVETPKPPKLEEKKWAMNGKRDPFFSPVVQQPTGSGCSTGKKCLEIGSINLHGVVKSDSGFIAVVTNNLGKAYFLRENDPVFNGYVMRITGDTVVFEENFQDKLGKPLTREVVKRITTPVV